ncbi:hypothetical protein AGMMS49942_23730 [Spirochaetia bacterium]|nr:hypothetical protein AGMMS49942_23730 [Spirochaetia bacterium]
MRKTTLFLLTAVVAVSTVFLMGCDPDKDTFTASTKEITNDVATLGLVGTSATSSKTNVATATIESGKVKITSAAEGTATITVSDGTNNATIAVVVAKTGAISETITKYTEGGGGNDNAKLVGTWTKGTLTATFESNGTWIISDSADGGEPQTDPSYEFKNNILNFGDFLGSVTAVLSDNDQTLTISGATGEKTVLNGAWTKVVD